jgi:imidazolonepropionase-like amidohydrolase
MAARLGQMLDAGYTTVRDAGGADAGFRTAVESGLIRGPRVFVSGRPLTQTGGHGDIRTPAESILTTGERIDQTKVVADGKDAVIRAVREEFRRGADQIKMMASGGVLSASDPLAPPQFSLDELSVAVAEARRRGSYVLAHAYSDEAIGQCAEAGVRSIEHGNFLTPATAARMREAGMFLVPTLLAYELLWEHSRTTLGAAELDKLQIVRAAGLRAVKVAAEAGVKIASGSDVMGPHLSEMGRELQLKTEALGSMGTLVATTRTNAELLRVEDEVGRLSEGLIADVLVVDGDPITDIALLGDRSRIHAVFRSGVLAAGQLWCRDRAEALLESAAQS